ncbi:MAG TPA: carboxypeptidase-like regulatory domain-containing protein [Planctomycetota bacterium]|nr:carboxypeptidase-like regulatory domain-containing protein [Planctomycetota bacterium]
MFRFLVPIGVLLLAALAWWLLAPDASAPQPDAARVVSTPGGEPTFDGLQHTEGEPRQLVGKGSARIHLEDGAGHSAWCRDDELMVFRYQSANSEIPTFVARVKTNTTDAISLEELEPGRHAVVFTHSTLGPLRGEFEVHPGEVADCWLPCGSPNLDRRITLRLVLGTGRDFPPDASCLSAMVTCAGSEPIGARFITSHLLVLDDCEPVDHDVVLRWRDEPPLELHGVQPGLEPHDVKLEGTATLEVMCRGAEDGAPVAGASVAVQFGAGDAVANIVHGSTDKQGRVVFGRLPAGPVLVGAHTRDRVPLEHRDTRLAAGAVVRCEMSLEPGCTIAGKLSYSTGEPAFGAVVVLGPQPPRLEPEPREDWEKELMARAERGGWHAWDLVPTFYESADFSITGLPKGTWRLVAGTPGPVVSEPSEVTTSPEQPVVAALHLPPARWLRGRIVVPPGSALPEFCVRCNRGFATGGSPAPVDADGAFSIGPLTPGPYTIVTCACSGHGSLWPARDGLSTLGEIEMPSDRDLVRSFDLGTEAPGTLDVAIHVQGPWPEDMQISAIPMNSHDGLISADVQAKHTSRSDGEGRASLAPVFRRQVQLLIMGDQWLERIPEVIDVPAWGHAEAQVEVKLVTATITVRGRRGVLPAGQNVRIGRQEELPWHVPATYVLDSNGQVRITAPTGTMVCSLDDDSAWPDADWAQVAWTPNGPEPATVELDEEQGSAHRRP